MSKVNFGAVLKAADKEYAFDIKVWCEDGEWMSSWRLPEIHDEDDLALYQAFFDQLFKMLTYVPGAEGLFKADIFVNTGEGDAEED